MGRIDREVRQRAFQLDATAAGVLLSPARYGNSRIGRNRGAGFVGADVVNPDFAGEDYALRFSSGLGQAALHK